MHQAGNRGFEMSTDANAFVGLVCGLWQDGKQQASCVDAIAIDSLL
jgi:hypothetical protein